MSKQNLTITEAESIQNYLNAHQVVTIKGILTNYTVNGSPATGAIKTPYPGGYILNNFELKLPANVHGEKFIDRIVTARGYALATPSIGGLPLFNVIDIEIISGNPVTDDIDNTTPTPPPPPAPTKSYLKSFLVILLIGIIGYSTFKIFKK